ncbi:MAG: penicillin-binding transpeptidase domain-containing protein [Candidatus Contendobacter sp.]
MKTGSIILLAALGFLAWRMATITPPALPNDQKPTEVQVLFEELRQRKDSNQSDLIRLEADGRLTLPQPDYALRLAWQRGEAVDKELARILHDLYDSAAGKALNSQLLLWNRSRRLAAVRDNHSGAITHANWRAYDCADSSLLSTEAPVPESFGYIHQGRIKTGFSDWIAIGAEAPCMEFRGQFRATTPVNMRILYLGTPQEATTSLQPYNPPRPLLPPKCPGFAAIPEHQAGEWMLPESAWRRSSGGAWELEARLRLVPAVNPDIKAAGLRIAFDDKACRPVWQPEPPTDSGSGSGSGSAYTISAADGPLLVDATGNPTTEARKLGLVPLVGFGPGDFASLSGLLRRSRPPSGLNRLTLTLDSRIQATARDVLVEGLGRFPKTDRYADERRAVLVVLDAADGAILAVAGHPEPPPPEQVTSWDFAAFSHVYPLQDPLRVYAWEGVDRHQITGSTIKPMVALAGLAAAKEGNADIAQMLVGWSPEQFARNTGLGLDATRIDPYQGIASKPAGWQPRPIKNFQGEALRNLLDNPLRDSPKCAANAGKNQSLGLAPALRDSLNIWFVAMALRLDGAASVSFDTDPRPLEQRPVPDLWLIKTLRKMGFGEPWTLFANPPDGLRPNPPSKDQLDLLGKNPSPLRWVLAQTAIGQGSLVTPLRMAALAASLARGAVIRPRLDAAWNDRNVVLQAPSPLDLDLTGIREGMKAVPEVGTAKHAFGNTPASIRCRTYAKTGTAEIGQTDGSGIESYNTGWLIGWYEPERDEARRLAFACMITHMPESDATGGKVCGPVVAELLKRLFPPAL